MKYIACFECGTVEKVDQDGFFSKRDAHSCDNEDHKLYFYKSKSIIPDKLELQGEPA